MLYATEFTKARGRTDVWPPVEGGTWLWAIKPHILRIRTRGYHLTTLKRFWGYLKNEEVQTWPHTLDVPRIHVGLIFWSRTIAPKANISVLCSTITSMSSGISSMLAAEMVDMMAQCIPLFLIVAIASNVRSYELKNMASQDLFTTGWEGCLPASGSTKGTFHDWF